MDSPSRASDLPEIASTRSEQLLVRGEALDSAVSELVAKKRQRTIFRALFAGVGIAKTVEVVLYTGGGDVVALGFTLLVLLGIAMAAEFSARPNIRRLEDVVAALESEVARLSGPEE